jgi:hypothetical protein
VPEMLCVVLNMYQMMDIIEPNNGTMTQSLSQTFRKLS